MRAKLKRVKGGLDVTLLCSCGRKLTFVDEQGMFCADKCGYVEGLDMEAEKVKMVGDILAIIEGRA